MLGRSGCSAWQARHLESLRALLHTGTPQLDASTPRLPLLCVRASVVSGRWDAAAPHGPRGKRAACRVSVQSLCTRDTMAAPRGRRDTCRVSVKCVDAERLRPVSV